MQSAPQYSTLCIILQSRIYFYMMISLNLLSLLDTSGIVLHDNHHFVFTIRFPRTISQIFIYQQRTLFLQQFFSLQYLSSAHENNHAALYNALFNSALCSIPIVFISFITYSMAAVIPTWRINSNQIERANIQTKTNDCQTHAHTLGNA